MLNGSELRFKLFIKQKYQILVCGTHLNFSLKFCIKIVICIGKSSEFRVSRHSRVKKMLRSLSTNENEVML